MAGPEQRTREGSLPRGMNEEIVTERKRPAMATAWMPEVG